MPTEIKLYHGTTEKVAKIAPMNGIKPYAVPHNAHEPVFSDPDSATIHLTNVYPALQAFSACQRWERWGIVEVLWEKMAGKLEPDTRCWGGRGKAPDWQWSLDQIGMCVCDEIPAKAIGKVWIFHPQSNWFITREILSVALTPEAHRQNLPRMTLLTNWLTGSLVSIDDWLGEEKKRFNREEVDKMSGLLSERSGLDLYRHHV